MKPVYWNAGFRFNDTNLRWGSPSYQLEPGDPGYVDPLPPSNQTKQRKKRMKHTNFYPRRQGDQIVWLTTFASQLPGAATALGLAAGTVTAAVADCQWVAYLLQTWLPAVRNWAQGCTDTVAAAQTGSGTGAMALPAFAAPALPTGVTAQAPGSLTRIFALVQSIKDGGKCSDALATTLGIVGAEETGPDLAAVQPPLAAKFNGSHVDVKTGWGGNQDYLDAIELQKDWGDGKGFIYHATLTGVVFQDSSALPAAKTVWAYRAIYRVAGQQTGHWSGPVSVAVGG